MILFENAMAYDILRRIKQQLTHCRDVNDGKDSFYIQSIPKKIEIRVSNHCTHLWTWHERKSGKFNDVIRISIVFENQDTYSDDNLRLKVPRQTPLRVWEFVYRIDTPQDISTLDVSRIIKIIKSTLKSGKRYNDPTGKLLYAKERVSKNPPTDESSNGDNQPFKNKKIIRLSEKDLNNMIKEAVIIALSTSKQR